jgi:trigger factor
VSTVAEQEPTTAESADAPAAEAQPEAAPAWRMTLGVDVKDIGPCKKHVKVKVPAADIAHIRDFVLDEMKSKAAVPGFRPGKAPKDIIAKRFGRELNDEIKQKVLIGSLEQLSQDTQIEPINEPDLDVENLTIPDAGDFEYEFTVEVRPSFDLPAYDQIKIKRPVRETNDSDIDEAQQRFLEQYAEHVPSDGAVEPGDFVEICASFEHKGVTLQDHAHFSARVRSTLRFEDGEIADFDKLLAGAKAGDSRDATITISKEAENLSMRAETVQARLNIEKVSKVKLPELNRALFQRVGVETLDELRIEIEQALQRQIQYDQRQAVRRQVLDKITASATWELPEDLVLKQVENAMYREVLEMQQAGYTEPQIRARENELRQHQVSMTRQAMKEHFILDKIATQENIEVSEYDVDTELLYMAMSRGENVRRMRARMEKSGVIENLEAQIRERKAVDVILSKAVFEDVPMEKTDALNVEAVELEICHNPDEPVGPKA